ncbi:MAG: YkvA family protein [Pseudomonadota bacterium]
MATRISLTLSNRDLRYFRDAVRRARDTVADAEEDEIVDAIRDVIQNIRSNGPLPDFITGRMPALELLTEMLSDEAWRLPKHERERLVATFIYFCDPEDLIPDDIPGIGYLDDVIMIELLMRDMRHVTEAYQDFCKFRDALDYTSGEDKAKKLKKRAAQLHDRMRRRLRADKERGSKSSLW